MTSLLALKLFQMNKRICIGIVAYDGLEGQVAEDYMRMMFHLGRRCPEYDFQLAIKSKSEQFRARNSIVRAALQNGADYIWMLDDDHIIDIDETLTINDAYSLPIKLAQHLEDNPKIGVVGALYYQRGGDHYPVVMQELNGNSFFIQHGEVSNRMQKVSVTGGGCMMIRASVFDKIDEPWFKPEHEFGTDIQLCRQVIEAGFEVWCDTSLHIGHLRNEKALVTQKVAFNAFATKEYEPLVSYRRDVEEYMGMRFLDVSELAGDYNPLMKEMADYSTLEDYYASRGPSQLARQAAFHHTVASIDQMKFFHNLVDPSVMADGADFGCGSAPIGFEYALRGHNMDFIDVDGSYAYEFTKWRAKKYKLDCGWELKGPYDYVLMLDSIEHISNWAEVLNDVIDSLKLGGGLVTNYFLNGDFNNPEHVSMDHDAVRALLIERGLTPINELLWAKKALDKEEAA